MMPAKKEGKKSWCFETMSRLAASVKIFLSSYNTQKSAQQDYSRNKDSKREPGDLLSCFALNLVLFCMRWSVWMCLFESLRRDGILSASHFTAHRNHPTEDDDQDAPNEIPGNSNDDGGRGKANGRANGCLWLWFTWPPPSLELHSCVIKERKWQVCECKWEKESLQDGK